MASTLKLEIVTPEAKVYSEDVDSVCLPGAEGELGIFPNHAPLMAQVKAGELIARKGGEETILAVGHGFVEITGDHVAILTKMVMRTIKICKNQCCRLDSALFVIQIWSRIYSGIFSRLFGRIYSEIDSGIYREVYDSSLEIFGRG